MTGTERLLVLGQMSFDRHLGIAEANQGNLVAFLGEHSELLRLAGSALGLVVARELVALVVDHYSFGNAYQPSWIVTRFLDFTILPSESFAQTWALTLSASLTG